MMAEVRKDGKWEAVGPIFKNPYYELTKQHAPDADWNQEYVSEPYGARNYDLFAILADVRNGYGFAGVPTGMKKPVIAQPRGIPDDCSKEVKEWMEQADHDASWLTLKELQEFDWDGTTGQYGVIPGDLYDEMIDTHGQMVDPYKMPDTSSYSGGVSGPGIVTFTPDGYEKWKDQGRPYIQPKEATLSEMISARESMESELGVLEYPMREGEIKPYVRIMWGESLRESVGEYWFEVLNQLSTLGDPENVRICFWFDS